MTGKSSTARSSRPGAKAKASKSAANSSASAPTHAECEQSGSNGAGTEESRDLVARGKPGPKTKLTAATVDRLIEALASGQSRRTAATMAGVSQSALFRWMAEGREDPDSPAGDLVRRVEQAEAEFLARHVANVERAAIEDKQWTASAWLLERKDPESWARKSRVSVEHAIAPPPDPSLGGVSGIMQSVVLQLASNPDVETWPEPLRVAYCRMNGMEPPGPTIEGEATEPEPEPAQAEAAAPGDLF